MGTEPSGMSSVDLKPAQPSHAPSGRASSTRIQALLLSLLLALGILAIYYPVHWQPFANYDDPDYVTDNVHVKEGLHWETVKWAMTTSDAANWHPVTWLSHALDWQLFGDDASGPHDVNVALHLLNALLLFWVLYRATGYLGRSWMVAALFALHPVNVESVAWIAERKNLLSMMFFLLTLGAYRWYTERPKEDRYLLVATLFALGLMAKPQVITLPFVLLLWDYWPLQRFSFGSAPVENASSAIPCRSLKLLILEKVPLLFLCLLSALMTIRAQAGGGATSAFARSLRVENAIVSYARYIGKAFWPTKLALFYPYSLHGFAWWQVAGSVLLLLGISVLVFVARQRRYLTTGWLWFLGTMVPMIGVMQVGLQAMADRYAYLTFIGLFIMVVWLIADWAEGLQPRTMLVRGLAFVVLAAFVYLAHLQVGYWNDHLTLWAHTLEVTNNNWIAENNYGTALLKLNRPEEAIPHFRAAYAAYQHDPNCILNLGIYEQIHGNYPQAIYWYDLATKTARNSRVKARAYNNLGYAYKANRDYIDAREALKTSVQIDPEFAGGWTSLGLLAQKTGDLQLAIAAYLRAVQLHPSDYGYLLLAEAYDAGGQKDKASAARQQALSLSNDIHESQRYTDKLQNQ